MKQLAHYRIRCLTHGMVWIACFSTPAVFLVSGAAGGGTGGNPPPVAAVGPASAAAPSPAPPASYDSSDVISLPPDLPEARVPRIIVLPEFFPPAARESYERDLLDKLQINSSQVRGSTFSGHLSDAFVQSRRFDVMERAKLEPVMKELDLVGMGYMDLQKVAKVGQMLNADLIVVPEIQLVRISLEEKEIPFVPKKRVTLGASLRSSLRVVDVRTTRVVSSGTLETLYSEPGDRAGQDPLRASVAFVDNFLAAAAQKEVSRIADDIFPIRVVSVAGNRLWLNRGERTIEVGEVLKILHPSDPIEDPSTKQILGYNAQCVAWVRVVEVLPQMCAAEITTAIDREKIDKTCFGRRQAPAATTSPAPAAPDLRK